MSRQEELDQERLEEVQGGVLGDSGDTRDRFTRTVPGGGSSEEETQNPEGGIEHDPYLK